MSALLAVLLLGQTAEPARLKILLNGKLMGYSSISHRITAGGGKINEEKLQIGKGNDTIRMVVTSVFGPDARPLRKEQLVTSRVSSQKVTVTFDEKGAHVTTVKDGKETVAVVPLVAGASSASVSEFWFLRDRPVPGTVSRAFTFDTNDGDWSLWETKYIGPKTIKLGDRKVDGFAIHSSNAKREMDYVVDAKGLLLLLEEDGGYRIERVNP